MMKMQFSFKGMVMLAILVVVVATLSHCMSVSAPGF